MKLIGLLGGMSWESTALYYRLINEETRNRCGGLHSARLLIHSVDFHDIEQLQHADQWDEAAAELGDAALGLKQAGADFLVIATNTMHKIADEIEQQSKLPLLHIADPTGSALVRNKVRRVALLGTRFTMEQAFYRSRLETKFGLDVLVPEDNARRDLHRIIYEELCLGTITQESTDALSLMIEDLQSHGAEAVILGCTEITLIVSEKTSALPVYDTTALHATAAVERALEQV